MKWSAFLTYTALLIAFAATLVLFTPPGILGP